MSQKALVEVILVLLTVRARMVFKVLEKTQHISSYWFVVQQKTSTFRRHEFDLFYSKFSPESNKLSVTLENRQQVAKKWLKLKHFRKPHKYGIRCLRVNSAVKNPRVVSKQGPLIISGKYLTF